MKAKANCKCKVCGKDFVKTTTKRNTKEADSWVVWAEANITTCEDCYKSDRIDSEIENGSEIKEMHYSEYKNNYSDCKTIEGSYDKDSKTIKVIISKHKQAKIEIIEKFPELATKPTIDLYIDKMFEAVDKMPTPPAGEKERVLYEIIKKYR